jgi:hypothetical protein
VAAEAPHHVGWGWDGAPPALERCVGRQGAERRGRGEAEGGMPWRQDGIWVGYRVGFLLVFVYYACLVFNHNKMYRYMLHTYTHTHTHTHIYIWLAFAIAPVGVWE